MNRTVNLLSVFVLLVLLVNPNGFAQRPDVVRIDSFVTALASHHLFNGSILVAEQGRIIYQKSAGYTDFNHPILNTDTTHVNLASLSKPFTALAVLQLVQTGKLKLEDTFIRYFPDFPYPAITIRHLLNQTTGLPGLERQEEPYIKAHPDALMDNRNVYSHLIESKKPLLFQPGDEWRYNNLNYMLLAMLVEDVSGQPFPAYMKRNVFIPAGMKATYVRSGSMPNTVRYTRPTFYFTSYHNVDSLDHNQFNTYYQLGGLTGPGNVVSTIQDVWCFDQAFFGGKLIRPELMKLAFEPVTLTNGSVFRAGNSTRSYGLGWSVYQSKTEPVHQMVFHDGHIPGITTFLHHNLTTNQTIIFYDNTDNNPLQVMISVSSMLKGQAPLSIQHKQSLVRLYGEALVAKGPDYAISRFNELKDDSTHYYLDEWEMNRLGFDLLQASFTHHNELSLEVFKLNTLLYPRSGNTYDSYAIALAQNDYRQEAIAMYRKSISLWPANEDGKKALKALLEK